MHALPTFSPGRVVSIDAFRGLTFVVMVFVNELAGVSGIPAWMKHVPADADAMTFVDVVFPAFLFIVGMSLPFSLNARLARGESTLQLQRYIALRALALIVIGVFMVNAESGYHASMPFSIHLWALLTYAAFMLVWGDFGPRAQQLEAGMRLAGVLLLIVLAWLYRGGPDGNDGMRPQWWGILGLIGWAYWLACEAYLLARGRLLIVLGLLAGCIAYYAAHRASAGGPLWLQALLSQNAHFAHAAIVLAGVACTLIFFDVRRATSDRRRFAQAALFCVVLLLAAYWLRPDYKISKIHATPSWGLYSSAACVVIFGALYALVQRWKIVRWTRLVEPAASNPLVTYLVPFVIGALMAAFGLKLPATWLYGATGIAWAAAFAVVVVAIVAVLNRWHVRLQL